MGKLLFLLPALLWAQTPETRVRPVDPGWKIISTWMPGYRETVKAQPLERPTPTVTPSPLSATPAPETRVLTVCEALSDLNRYNLETIVIVGIFKSGMDETLRQDCPRQLVTAEVSWPNAIGLSNPAAPPDGLRDEIEKKRVELITGYSREAKPRPERVVGLYGRLASPSGLTTVDCCRGSVETTIPPARLFGLAEKDLRVIR